ncbi:hypothetical protein HYC85_021697 [Camellia sinensis]|uniref:Transcription repressor n=1 Tax=Camellia sinensis TaxID=4442 RepID=A0A7J7GIC7_CAMSI|nr:hypothetical protein HYC85_021697 [Camellia sinensis]
MSNSNNMRKVRLNTVTVNLGCSSCQSPRLSNIFHPKPKSKTPTTYHHRKHTLFYHTSSTSSSDNANPPHCADEQYTTTTTTTTDTTPLCQSDSDTESDIRSLRAVQGFGRICSKSVAVEKDSDDPYLDFRRSMVEMIVAKEIYSRDDLRELLNCFLQLNSPYYHGIIVRAFTEIWDAVFSLRIECSSPKLHLPHNSRAPF